MATKANSKKTAAKKIASKKSAVKATATTTTKKVVAAKKLVQKKAPAKKVVAKKIAVKKVAPRKVVPQTSAKKTIAAKTTPQEIAPKTNSPKPAVASKNPAPVKSEPLAATEPSRLPQKPAFVPPKPEVKHKVSTESGGKHSESFIQKQRQRLLDLKDELVDAMSGVTRDTIRNAPEGSEASGSGMHQGDAGSDAYDRDFALSVLAQEQDALYEIDQALQRIKKGTYGNCEISGKKIPQTRLEAIPFARLTVECQTEWEKDYGNRRYRPSNEVGFSGWNSHDSEDSDAVFLDEDEE